MAALRSIVQGGRIPGITTTDTDIFLSKGISRLLSMQTSSGGFGYWPGDSHPHAWGTIYAMTALSQAKLAGFTIEEQRMDRALQYLKQNMNQMDRTWRSFAAYILALNGQLDRDIYDKLYSPGNNDREGDMLLLTAGKLMNFTSEAETQAMIKLLDQQDNLERSNVFYARYREPAIALIASTAYFPDDKRTTKALNRLMEGVSSNGIWTSTSDTGWSLMALGKYYTLGETRGDSTAKGKTSTVTVQQAGWPPMSIALNPAETYTMQLEPRTFLKSPNLSLTSQNGDTLVYELSMMYPREDYARYGYENGFKINKTIENTAGTPEVRVGDIVKITLKFNIPSAGYTYIVVDDPLPAGLVAINTLIKTEEAVESSSNSDAYNTEVQAYGFNPHFFEMRDDRVLAFRNFISREDNFYFTYFARAVAEGEFVMPSAKIQLMYKPGTSAYTPVTTFSIQARQ